MYKKIRKIYEIYYKKRRSFAEEINEVFNELSDTYRVSDIDIKKKGDSMKKYLLLWMAHSYRINILRNHPGAFSYCII